MELQKQQKDTKKDNITVTDSHLNLVNIKHEPIQNKSSGLGGINQNFTTPDLHVQQQQQQQHQPQTSPLEQPQPQPSQVQVQDQQNINLAQHLINQGYPGGQTDLNWMDPNQLNHHSYPSLPVGTNYDNFVQQQAVQNQTVPVNALPSTGQEGQGQVQVPANQNGLQNGPNPENLGQMLYQNNENPHLGLNPDLMNLLANPSNISNITGVGTENMLPYASYQNLGLPIPNTNNMPGLGLQVNIPTTSSINQNTQLPIASVANQPSAAVTAANTISMPPYNSPSVITGYPTSSLPNGGIGLGTPHLDNLLNTHAGHLGLGALGDTGATTVNLNLPSSGGKSFKANKIAKTKKGKAGKGKENLAENDAKASNCNCPNCMEYERLRVGRNQMS